MSTLPFPLSFPAPARRQDGEQPRRASLVSRVFDRLVNAVRIDAVIDSRQRLAEARVARYLERQGVERLTDNIERDIGRLL